MNVRFQVNGKTYVVRRANHPNKKFKVHVGKDTILFGQKGYRINPGTSKGDAYCARSYGIKNRDNIKSANYWSRKMWKCKGKKSKK